MIKNLLKSKTQTAVLGLDIGTESIKAVEAERKGDEISILRAGYAQRPKDSRRLSDSIIRLIKETGIRARGAVTSFSGENLFLRYITLPEMSQEDVQKALPFQIDGQLPYKADELAFTCKIIGKDEKNGQRKLRVLYAATPMMALENLTLALRASGLEPVAIDTDATALENIWRLQTQNENETALLCDIGASTAKANLICQGKSQLVKEIPTGGRDIAQDLREMKTFCQLNLGQSKIDRLILSGGGALLKNLDAHLSKELGIPAEICNPFAPPLSTPLLPSNADPTIFTLATCFALRGLVS